MKTENKYTLTPKREYELSMPMCLWEDDKKDLKAFKDFVTPYFDNLFGSEEFGECLWEGLPDENEISEEEHEKIDEAYNYAIYNKGCYNFKTQPEFFANIIKIHKTTGEYALERYLADFEFDIHNYARALRKYVKKLVKEGK